MTVPIGGECDSRFAAVRAAFEANFATEGEVGAAVTVIVDGRTVVDLHGGFVDGARTRAWSPDTLVNFYSVGKAIVGLLTLQLVDAGLIGLDDPVTRVWPEFGVGGKETATLRQAFCHQAAVPAIRAPLTNDALWNWQTMTDALAASAAWWVPGERHAYHTNTYGFLLGEIARRITGDSPHDRLRAVTEPLDADVWFGVPPAEQHRCAELLWTGGGVPDAVDFTGLAGDALMEMMSYVNPAGLSSMGVVNTPEWRATQIPSTNGHGTARGVARLYEALLQPSRLVSEGLLTEATRAQSTGWCPILHDDVSFGLGFKPTTPRRPFGPNPRSFGHFGTGGAVGFADPDANVAFGYVMNHVIPRWQSSRNRALIDAVYASL